MKGKLVFAVILLVSFVMLMPNSVLACERQPLVCIEKEAYCMKPTPGPPDTFSNNPPY